MNLVFIDQRVYDYNELVNSLNDKSKYINGQNIVVDDGWSL